MILLTAVIVVLVGGFGVIFLGAAGGGSDGPQTDAEVTATDDRVSVTHAGGESAAIGDLDVVLRSDEESERHTFDAANVTNDDGDERFDPGERFRRSHGLGSGELEVRVVHTESNAVLETAYLDT